MEFTIKIPDDPLLKFKPREEYDPESYPGYYASDRDFFDDNRFLIVNILNQIEMQLNDQS